MNKGVQIQLAPSIVITDSRTLAYVLSHTTLKVPWFPLTFTCAVIHRLCVELRTLYPENKNSRFFNCPSINTPYVWFWKSDPPATCYFSCIIYVLNAQISAILSVQLFHDAPRLLVPEATRSTAICHIAAWPKCVLQVFLQFLRIPLLLIFRLLRDQQYILELRHNCIVC